MVRVALFSCRRALLASGYPPSELSWRSPGPSLIAGLWATYVPDSPQFPALFGLPGAWEPLTLASACLVSHLARGPHPRLHPPTHRMMHRSFLQAQHLMVAQAKCSLALCVFVFCQPRAQLTHPVERRQAEPHTSSTESY